MDASNKQNLEKMAPDEDSRHKVKLLRDFDSDSAKGSEVPDPYYGGPEGFENVFDVVEAACRGLLAHVREYNGL